MEHRISCGAFRRKLYHFQAGELPEGQREAFSRHLGDCPDCARRLAVEDEILGALKGRLRRVPAPPGLDERVRAALRQETGSGGFLAWFRSPWLVPAAAALLLAVLLMPALGGFGVSGSGSPAGVVRVDTEVVVVDLDCDRAGKTLAQQRRCEHPLHLNALKVSPGRYWSVSLDQELSRHLVADEEMRGHRLHVEGDLYTGIRTLRLSDFTDLGMVGVSARVISRDDF